MQAKYESFFQAPAFAVAGASTNREKFGNKVLRCLLKHNRQTFAVNPRAQEIEGTKCYPDIQSLPTVVTSLAIITPPAITLELVEAAAAKGITHIWMQPGAEHQSAIAYCKQHGIEVIANGPCILVELNFHEL